MLSNYDNFKTVVKNSILYIVKQTQLLAFCSSYNQTTELCYNAVIFSLVKGEGIIAECRT